jgi:hypothetical protein
LDAVRKRLPALKAALAALRPEAEAAAERRTAKEARSEFLGPAKSKKRLARMLHAED